MKPRFKILPEKKLIGKNLEMSFAQNRTAELWRSFMPERKNIKHAISTDLYSLQEYPDSFDFRNLNPTAVFRKWAATEVSESETIPEGMACFTLAGGLYAVFLHKGGPETGAQTMQYIFGTWLPDSEYELDNRPHFELLSDKYKNNSPDSEEEFWIPVKLKQ